MNLNLIPIPVPHGSYDINGDGKAEEMPARLCYLAPDAARAWEPMHDLVVVSDMWRSPESSRNAVKAGRGASAPGFSGHNYGVSVDIDVRKTLDRLGLALKAELDAWMASHGWRCWRDDFAMPSWRHGRPNEAWHYNYAPKGVRYSRGNCVDWLEMDLVRRYPLPITRPWKDVQDDLKTLGLYKGRLDGSYGPLTRAALDAFIAEWGSVLRPTQRYNRTLAFCAAAKRWQEGR